MEAPIFEAELENLMLKNCINKDDFFNFTKRFYILTEKIRMVKKQQNPYVSVTKKWIAAFQIIFGKSKVTAEMLEYMNKFCSILTLAFLRLADMMDRDEPLYHHEFYYHWGKIMTMMTASKRLRSFIRYAVHFKILLTHLKTAKNRCQQIGILNVLIPYIQQVPLMELEKLKENNGGKEDDYLIYNLFVLAGVPSNTNKNDFLHAVNYIGSNILSVKPSKVESESFQLDYSISEYEIFIDFNLKERSIMFAVVSKSTDVTCCTALIAYPELREYKNHLGDYMLTVQGLWTMLEKGGDPFTKVVAITFQLPIETRSVLWKPNVRSKFKVLPKMIIHRRESKSTSGSDCEVQSKITRRAESVVASNLDDVFNKLKHSVAIIHNPWHRPMDTDV